MMSSVFFIQRSILPEQWQPILESVLRALLRVRGVAAVSLAGSHAGGVAREHSDLDIGVYYSEQKALLAEEMAQALREIDDNHNPIVTGLQGWGPWANGGAWLRVKNKRVDIIYRSLERLESVVEESREGLFSIHLHARSVIGFYSYVYLGELAIAKPLYDPLEELARLKRFVASYPPRLREAILRENAGQLKELLSWCESAIGRGDYFCAFAGFGRIASCLVQYLFAVNGVFFVNDKYALESIESMSLRPKDFSDKMRRLFDLDGQRLEWPVRLRLVADLIKEVLALEA